MASDLRDAEARPWPDVFKVLRGKVNPTLWRSAARRLISEPETRRTHGRRSARLAVLATHTTDFLTELLPVAGLSCGIDLALEPVPFGQPEAWLLDPADRRAAGLDYTVLLGTYDDLQLEAAEPDQVVAAAVQRWTGLWELVRERTGSRVIQGLFTAPPDDASGTGTVLDGDAATVARINIELTRSSHDGVLFVDCDRLAGDFGRSVWRDDRHWRMLRLPVSPAALPALARALAGALAADLGLTTRCLALDLDDTLWGGVLGEDGFGGVVTDGAFAHFQEHLLGLQRRGILLAVASKNDPDLVEQALLKVPGMRLGRGDFAAVVADWRPKSEQLRDIAARLRLGSESLALVDDNPAECAEVAAHLPEADVILLPDSPSRYVDALAGRPTLAVAATTSVDLTRSASYTALAAAEELRLASDSLADFLNSLRMRGAVRPLAPAALDRAAQLVQKTNQFNLTGRRHSSRRLQEFATDPEWYCVSMSLRDRFADHGEVGVLLMHVLGREAEIDTLLLSCRVIGRTVERRLVAEAATAARAAGCVSLVGVYVPSARNGLVAGLYEDLGFRRHTALEPTDDGASHFIYSLDRPGPGGSPHIEEDFR